MSHFDRRGRPIGLLEWAYMFENEKNRRVAQTALAKHKVSTVWIGLANNIFETMVFEEDSSVDCARYSTLKEAIKGHASMVAKWQALEAKK